MGEYGLDKGLLPPTCVIQILNFLNFSDKYLLQFFLICSVSIVYLNGFAFPRGPWSCLPQSFSETQPPHCQGVVIRATKVSYIYPVLSPLCPSHAQYSAAAEVSWEVMLS